MSSTTEDSDWNMSPRSRRLNALSNADSGQSSPQPFHLGQNDTEDADPSLSTPHASGLGEAVEQQHIRQPQNVAESIIMPTHSRLPIPVNADTSENGALQDTPEWDAARDAVLSQMVTSQDIVAASTPPSTIKVKRGGIKTGGRRGRGGRRPKVKIEGEDNITAEIAAAAGVKTDNIPVRGKNKGGRPRGSRAGMSSRGGIVRPELSAPGTPVTPVMKNKGGRPRGSKTINRGGRPRGSRAANSAAGLLGHIAKKKRKRGTDDEDEPDDTSASEEFTPLAITSSGRRINPTQTYSPLLIEATTSARRPSNNTPTSAPQPSSTQRPKKRRKPGEAAVCINCGRGHSPNTNQIVFCDGCNTPWHQFCHNRPITPTVIQFEEKEWLCFECEIVREEKSHISGKVSASPTMTPAEKRTYLRTLEKNELVSLLLHANTLHPDLPIFRPPVPIIVEPQPTRPPPNHHNIMQVGEEEEAEVYEYIEPEPLPYPKAGNGIVLPPEEEDLALLIDEDIVTYSHLWKGPHGWEGPKGMRFPWPEGPLGGSGVGGGGMGGGGVMAGGRVAIGVGA